MGYSIEPNPSSGGAEGGSFLGEKTAELPEEKGFSNLGLLRDRQI
jgi:hypothetical protein